MILLTGEEIRVINDKVEEEYEDIEMTDAEWEEKRYSIISKAQAKKVVDELGVCLCSCTEDEEGITYRVPFKKWQALLEEIK